MQHLCTQHHSLDLEYSVSCPNGLVLPQLTEFDFQTLADYLVVLL